jgi:hypothetical protein
MLDIIANVGSKSKGLAMTALIIPFPTKCPRPVTEAPRLMWRVEGGGLAFLVEDAAEAVAAIRDGWERAVSVARDAGGSYRVEPVPFAASAIG